MSSKLQQGIIRGLIIAVLLAAMPKIMNADNQDAALEAVRPDTEPIPAKTEPESPAVPSPTAPPAGFSDSHQMIKVLLEEKFAPPLSLEEAIRIIEMTIALLDPDMEQYQIPRRDKTEVSIKMISDLVQLMDDRNSSLLNYRWYYIGYHRVEDPALEEDHFDVQPPLHNVSGISFEADINNVNLQYMKVIDLHNQITEFRIDKWIIAGLPRKEVCYLYFPSTIREIIIGHSVKPEKRARLRVFLGVTDQPEYAKAAMFYLARARSGILANKFKEARTDLEKARENLILFNRQSRF